jgi:hypothetical protein
MTYRFLKTVVTILKEEGKKAFPEATIRVGETFDIGPEFALSDFKYNRHTEICTQTSGVDKLGFIDVTSVLKCDDRPYAAYPDGIPDGTLFSSFFGKQAQCFLSDMEFDWAVDDSNLSSGNVNTLFENIEKQWAAKGYKLPHLIFWNVDARQNNIPMLGNGPISYVSGMSPSIFETIMSGKTGYDLMMEKLNSDRYAVIQ